MTRLRARVAMVAAALAILVAGIGATTSVQVTESAWTDKVHASAVATGGTWTVPSTVGCVAMNANGTPKNGGRCTVTSVVVAAEWGNPGDRTRNYTVNFNTNAGNGYVQFTVDLSQAGGPFSWTNAGIVAPSQQAIPDNGWTCAQLPVLTAKTPTNWGWGTNSSIFFQVTENRTNANTVCG